MEQSAAPTDHRLTVIAMSVLAYLVQDVLHEGLGHGVTAWLSGAHTITISSVALQSDIDTRWISANGTLVNLVFAALLWIVLSRSRRLSPRTRYFLVLVLAGNLFTGTGYFFFSGVTNFGDWAAVIRGLEPHWAWQIGLIVVGAAMYYASMLLVAAQLRPFRAETGSRIRALCWTPYFTEGAFAGLAGLLNPAGLFYVIASALPSTLGANAGMISLPFMMQAKRYLPSEPAGPIRPGLAWIIVAAIVTLLFILIVAPGLSFVGLNRS